MVNFLKKKVITKNKQKKNSLVFAFMFFFLKSDFWFLHTNKPRENDFDREGFNGFVRAVDLLFLNYGALGI